MPPKRDSHATKFRPSPFFNFRFQCPTEGSRSSSFCLRLYYITMFVCLICSLSPFSHILLNPPSLGFMVSPNTYSFKLTYSVFRPPYLCHGDKQQRDLVRQHKQRGFGQW